jgi:hypothetical protein
MVLGTTLLTNIFGLCWQGAARIWPFSSARDVRLPKCADAHPRARPMTMEEACEQFLRACPEMRPHIRDVYVSDVDSPEIGLDLVATRAFLHWALQHNGLFTPSHIHELLAFLNDAEAQLRNGPLDEPF